MNTIAKMKPVQKKMNTNDGHKFISSEDTIINAWPQNRESDNAPRNSAFLSEGWSGV